MPLNPDQTTWTMMSFSHISDIISLPDNSSILQLNSRRSQPVIQALFNEPLSHSFIAICIQEPYVNPFTKIPPSHKGWTLVVPDVPEPSEASRPRVCIYVNNQFSPLLTPVTSNSRDVAICRIRTAKVDVVAINVYNQPGTFDGFTDFTRNDELFNTVNAPCTYSNYY